MPPVSGALPPLLPLHCPLIPAPQKKRRAPEKTRQTSKKVTAPEELLSELNFVADHAARGADAVASLLARLVPRFRASVDKFSERPVVNEEAVREGVRDVLHESRGLRASRAKALEAQAEAETVSSDQLCAYALELEAAVERGEAPQLSAMATAALEALAPADSPPCVSAFLTLPLAYTSDVYESGTARVRSEVSVGACSGTEQQPFIAGMCSFARDGNTLRVECRGDDGDMCESIQAGDIDASAEGAVVDRVEMVSPGEALLGFIVPDAKAARPVIFRVHAFNTTSRATEITIPVGLVCSVALHVA